MSRWAATSAPTAYPAATSISASTACATCAADNAMSKKRNTKSIEIALSAISCALDIHFLLLGTLSVKWLATGYIMAQICLMLPLSRGFCVGDVLAYIGTCILPVLLGAMGQAWLLVPFAMFFGLHPLLNALQLRFNANRWIAYIIKAAW